MRQETVLAIPSDAALVMETGVNARNLNQFLHLSCSFFFPQVRKDILYGGGRERKHSLAFPEAALTETDANVLFLSLFYLFACLFFLSSHNGYNW